MIQVVNVFQEHKDEINLYYNFFGGCNQSPSSFNNRPATK